MRCIMRRRGTKCIFNSITKRPRENHLEDLDIYGRLYVGYYSAGLD